MRYGSPALKGVLAGASFDTRWVADVFYDGQRKIQDAPVVDISYDEDGTSKIQQSGSMTIVWQDARGASIAPVNVEDVLSPFGTTVTLYLLVTAGPSFTERVTLGTFSITETPSVETTRWRWLGLARSKGDRIKVQFKDAFYKVQRNRFDAPSVSPSLLSVYGELQRLTQLPVTRSPLVLDAALPNAVVYEEERLDAVYEVATALDAVPYMTSDGTLSLRPNAWGPAVDTIEAADASDGPTQRGTLLRVSRGMSADGVYNRVVVRSSGQDAQVLGEAEISEGVLRAQNLDGSASPFGRVPLFMSSQFITTPSQAIPAARAQLGRVSRPQAVVLEIEEIINPLREVGDVVNVLRRGEKYAARVRSVARSAAKSQTTTVVMANV